MTTITIAKKEKFRESNWEKILKIKQNWLKAITLQGALAKSNGPVQRKALYCVLSNEKT